MTLVDTSTPVVLLDRWGAPVASADKATVHHRATPLHLGFSCHLVRRGHVLLTRRAAVKRTWPGVWTNACCGHPRPGESLREAVTRHLRHELGVAPSTMTLAIGDFAYRATMGDGTVEHELCPVVVAEFDGDPDPNPAEVDDWCWVPWPQVVERARSDPRSLSPWSVLQIDQLAHAAVRPDDLLRTPGLADGRLEVPPGGCRRPPPDVSGLIGTVRRSVTSRLRTFLDERRTDVPEAGDAVDALGRVVAALAVGGKRLRPGFVVWGHIAAGGASDAGVLDVAAATELLHAFALVHDDVMDRSDLRRGRPTAHRVLEASAPAGADREWFGVSAAILAGDLAHVWAQQLFDRAETTVDRDRMQAARSIFTQLRTEVIAGQYLDVHLGPEVTTGERDASRVALLKSARYTVTRPLQLGAAMAGAPEGVRQRLGAYGDAVGLAFQLRDDVIGIFGDPCVTGKSALDDLRDGKRTILVQRALTLATPAGRTLLRAALGDRGLDEDRANACRDVIADTGALASVEAAIDIHLARATTLASDLPDRAAAALTGLAEYAARRDR